MFKTRRMRQLYTLTDCWKNIPKLMLASLSVELRLVSTRRSTTCNRHMSDQSTSLFLSLMLVSKVCIHFYFMFVSNLTNRLRFVVEEDTLLDMVHSMKDDVALVHQMPFVCDRKGFPAVLEKVCIICTIVHTLFHLICLLFLYYKGLLWNSSRPNIPLSRFSANQLSNGNVRFDA